MLELVGRQKKSRPEENRTELAQSAIAEPIWDHNNQMKAALLGIFFSLTRIGLFFFCVGFIFKRMEISRLAYEIMKICNY